MKVDPVPQEEVQPFNDKLLCFKRSFLWRIAGNVTETRTINRNIGNLKLRGEMLESDWAPSGARQPGRASITNLAPFLSPAVLIQQVLPPD